MNSNFESFQNRFSETAEKILRDSEMIAQATAEGIDTQHLLAALSNNPGTVAYEALRDLMINTDRIALIASSSIHKLKTASGVSDDLKRALKTAYRKAGQYHSSTVDSEHLLLALLVNKHCNAYLILKELSIDPESLRQQLEDYFDHLVEQHQPLVADHGHLNDEEELEEALSSGYQTDTSSKAPVRPKTAIDYFTIDLTKQAKAGKLDPVIGRTDEIRRMTQILVRRVKNNPILTGEPGVGKTAIVEGLASRIAAGEAPNQLADKRVLSLDLALLISGTTYRGQFEERTKKLLDEIIKSGNVILFVDELHTIVGAGAAEGSMDLSNILKPALAKGQLRLIGATTNDEYRKYIEKDPALERRLQRISVEEPSLEETVQILNGLKATYEKHHNVTITEEAVAAAVELSSRYISDRYLPDKAIDLIDEAAAATQLEEKQLKVTGKITDLEKRHGKAKLDHQRAAESFDYQKAAEFRVLELRLQNEIERLRERLPKRAKSQAIGREDIAKIVSMWSGVPVTALRATDKVRLTNLEKSLKEQIIGQTEAITTIAAAVKRSSAGVGDPNRPLGSFIFLGPTGVGKTELAKVLARTVYGREQALVKIDMSEFMERHNVSRLVGAPPGYVGYDDAGKLTETIRRQPYSVVLLDEIEKAHPDIFNMLLQIMEDGYLTDAKGRRVNFRNTIIIMTSNIGMSELSRQAGIGFKSAGAGTATADQHYEDLKDRVLGQLQDYFRPEFLNRLDKVLVFRPLTPPEIRQIVTLQLERLLERLSKEGIELTVEESAKSFIAERGFDPEYGARPIRRVITDYIEDPLAELLLSGRLSKKSPIRVLKKGDKLVLVK